MYNDNMYENRNHDTKSSAIQIVSVIKSFYPDIRSVLDVGCGTGTFLSVFQDEFKNLRVLGIEGPWVKSDFFEVDRREILVWNLANSFPLLDQRFDLAICLEVAEHLPIEIADTLVNFLCSSANLVLFSAAIPFQGGVGHVNERWQSYWASIFNKNGFKVKDIIRPLIWKNTEISYWYRQNILIFEKVEGVNEDTANNFIDLVHPEAYLKRINRATPLFKRIISKIFTQAS
jgi:SAM-dependent methyltransferase